MSLPKGIVVLLNEGSQVGDFVVRVFPGHHRKVMMRLLPDHMVLVESVDDIRALWESLSRPSGRSTHVATDGC